MRESMIERGGGEKSDSDREQLSVLERERERVVTACILKERKEDSNYYIQHPYSDSNKAAFSWQCVS